MYQLSGYHIISGLKSTNLFKEQNRYPTTAKIPPFSDFNLLNILKEIYIFS